jgi:quinone-modifying oxidoreductase subunit QmoC
MEAAEGTSQGAGFEGRPGALLAEDGKPLWIEPDLEFIQWLGTQGAESFKKCFQCGTCSATCPISPETEPFPRKEMAWAAWGMKERLLADPDIWLCHHCNDCSTRCPRGGRPGDVLAALRQQSVLHYSVPTFLAKWVNQARFAPLLLTLPAILLGLALILRDPLARSLGFTSQLGGEIVYSYSSFFPHWLINSFFGFFGLLAMLATLAGVFRFWRALPSPEAGQDGKGLFQSIRAALKKIIVHDRFSQCKTTIWRFVAHLCVFFGFIALTAVTLWVITGRINPLIQGDFVYPFSFWSPWKMLANLGGIVLLMGCILLIYDRLEDSDRAGSSTYFDWFFLLTLAIVTFTGFATEFMHYLRLEPHRHVIYFIHLVFVFGLLIYLPYSKFAHIAYRTAAMVHAEYTGRKWGDSIPADPGRDLAGEQAATS